MTDGFEGYVTASVMSPGNDDASEQAPVQGTSRVMQVRGAGRRASFISLMSLSKNLLANPIDSSGAVSFILEHIMNK
jgi:hypothetical protein